jgi:hypothetical protein
MLCTLQWFVEVIVDNLYFLYRVVQVYRPHTIKKFVKITKRNIPLI